MSHSIWTISEGNYAKRWKKKDLYKYQNLTLIIKQEFFTISVHEIWNIENMEKWKV